MTPDGSQPGLQGAYVVQTGPSPVSMTRVDAQLNFVWYHQCFVVSPLADVRSQLADRLYAVASDPSTLARWEHEPGTNPEQWQAHWACWESLDVARHKSWAQFVAHPALLKNCATGPSRACTAAVTGSEHRRGLAGHRSVGSAAQ